jgi:hypothetical protein
MDIDYNNISSVIKFVIHNQGELPKGLYFYTIVPVKCNVELFRYNIIQINAFHKTNSIVLTWDSLPEIFEYRIYRSVTPDLFEGYFTVYSNEGYFHDDGRGLLNLAYNG